MLPLDRYGCTQTERSTLSFDSADILRKKTLEWKKQSVFWLVPLTLLLGVVTSGPNTPAKIIQ